MVPESEIEKHEAQVNLTEATEDLNQSSDEPRASFVQEGKPQSIILYFQLMYLLFIYIYMVLCI
jgi:hypothetical protein